MQNNSGNDYNALLQSLKYTMGSANEANAFNQNYGPGGLLSMLPQAQSSPNGNAPIFGTAGANQLPLDAGAMGLQRLLAGGDGSGGYGLNRAEKGAFHQGYAQRSPGYADFMRALSSPPPQMSMGSGQVNLPSQNNPAGQQLTLDLKNATDGLNMKGFK